MRGCDRLRAFWSAQASRRSPSWPEAIRIRFGGPHPSCDGPVDLGSGTRICHDYGSQLVPHAFRGTLNHALPNFAHGVNDAWFIGRIRCRTRAAHGSAVVREALRGAVGDGRGARLQQSATRGLAHRKRRGRGSGSRCVPAGVECRLSPQLQHRRAAGMRQVPVAHDGVALIRPPLMRVGSW